jgi:hypothetical protein
LNFVEQDWMPKLIEQSSEFGSRPRLHIGILRNHIPSARNGVAEQGGLANPAQ